MTTEEKAAAYDAIVEDAANQGVDIDLMVGEAAAYNALVLAAESGVPTLERADLFDYVSLFDELRDAAGVGLSDQAALAADATSWRTVKALVVVDTAAALAYLGDRTALW